MAQNQRMRVGTFQPRHQQTSPAISKQWTLALPPRGRAIPSVLSPSLPSVPRSNCTDRRSQRPLPSNSQLTIIVSSLEAVSKLTRFTVESNYQFLSPHFLYRLVIPYMYSTCKAIFLHTSLQILTEFLSPLLSHYVFLLVSKSRSHFPVMFLSTAIFENVHLINSNTCSHTDIYIKILLYADY